VSESLRQVIDRFTGLNVLVIGEVMLDAYLDGTTRRLCQEAPVPVIDLKTRQDRPGGAANSAVNARALGARVSLCSVIGDDAEGALLRKSLHKQRIETTNLLTELGRKTLAKHRVSAGNHLFVRFDQGCTGPIASEVEAALIARIESAWAEADAVVISDYNYGIFTPAVVAKLATLQANAPRVVVADSRRLETFRGVRPTAVKPNYEETLGLLNGSAPDPHRARAEWMMAQGPRILELTGARIAAVTIDAEGALVFEHDRPPYRTYAVPRRSSRTSGAGDTFVATLALALAAGAETPAAADLASAASAVVVEKKGTASCGAAELIGRVTSPGKVLKSLDELKASLRRHRRRGRRIVFTNGCFDILHRGHVSYLSSAKALGDVLVVGVNTDASIRRLKGPERPINGLEDRVQVLEALSCVDQVVAFDEDTPEDLIRVVQPDVFVKGGDYTRATLPEASVVEQFGGVIQILPFVTDRSTTDIIAKIRHSCAGKDGAWLKDHADNGVLSSNGHYPIEQSRS
jgi:D-beta-D-heptose 7-phosphate kinase / D-beta-D-heptose 1-phosphate adenosyltransferase